MPDQTLGDRIRDSRIAAELTQHQLAVKLGDSITGQTISSYEANRHVPENERLLRIAEILGKSVAWLHYGVE